MRNTARWTALFFGLLITLVGVWMRSWPETNHAFGWMITLPVLATIGLFFRRRWGARLGSLVIVIGYIVLAVAWVGLAMDSTATFSQKFPTFAAMLLAVGVLALVHGKVQKRAFVETLR